MIAALLVDLDGVLYVEDEPVPGAVEAIEELRRSGLRLRFVTNTTSRPKSAIVDRLGRLGFAVPADEVVTPAALAVDHCRRRGHRRVALLMTDAVKADFAGLEESERDADAVIVGDLGRGFTYDTLNEAFRLVMDGAELVALQKNGVASRDAAMVGDDVESDIGGALAAGLGGILVRTGKYREDVVRRSGIAPSLVVDSIADLPQALRRESSAIAWGG